MKIPSIGLASLLALVLTGCNYYGYTPTHGVDEGTIMSHEGEGMRISHAVMGLSEKWNLDNHLRLQDSAYHWRGDHPVIRLDFVSQDTLEIGEARALIVDIVDDLMGKLNGEGYENFDKSNMEESEELDHIPYDTANLQIFINFESFYGLMLDPYYVGCITMMDNLVSYNAFNTQENSRDRWSHREEWFFQARDFVQTTREAKIAYEEEHKNDDSENVFEGLRYRPGVKSNRMKASKSKTVNVT